LVLFSTQIPVELTVAAKLGILKKSSLCLQLDIYKQNTMSTTLLKIIDGSELLLVPCSNRNLPPLQVKHFECSAQAVHVRREKPWVVFYVDGATTYNIVEGYPFDECKFLELIHEYEQYKIREAYLLEA
jgi:hypothetical protein